MTTETATALDTAEVGRVMRQFDKPNDRAWCGWVIHGSPDPGHVLINCDVPDSWARTMPGPATSQGIAQHLTRYAEALREAGFGTAMWKWRGYPDVLIVATDQRHADEIAPGICTYLTELNPDDEEIA